MNSAGERPDPDQLLATVQAEETRARRGRLRIFFGASAGVGKTYAMLEAARVERAAGRDIVVGYVEPHGRQETERLMEGLEQLPVAAGPVSQRRAPRVRPRRGPAAPRRDHPGRRARSLEPRRGRAAPATREALAGHRGAARRRHQRLDDRQRPAPREPQRSRRADHGRAAARDHPGPHIRRGRRSRADRPATGRPARPAQGRQGLPPRAGRCRRRAILPQGQPAGVARDRAAPHRRSRRRGGARRARDRLRDPAVARARPPDGRGRA